MPEMHADTGEEINKSAVWSAVVTPEEDLGVDAVICKETVGEEDTNGLVANEEENDEILEGISVHISDNEINLEHFIF